MSENNGKGKDTSYSVNKGDELVICLRSKKKWNEFHDKNLIMYVILHELSHIGCPGYGHGDLFKKIFAFFTQVAIELKLYSYVDYSKNPVIYCGLEINASII